VNKLLEQPTMKNWLLPIAVLGVSGLGLMCASERGRRQIQGFFERITHARDPLGEFNKAVESQLDMIQRTLDHLSEALEAPQVDSRVNS
jgi:hypothetical protein